VQALLTGLYIKEHSLTFIQAFEIFTDNSAKMNKYVITAVFLRNKNKSSSQLNHFTAPIALDMPSPKQ